MRAGVRPVFGILIALIIPACGPGPNNKPPSTPANPPTNLIAAQGNTARISLTWTDNATNEAGFKIQRSEDGGATFVEIDSVPTDTQAYTDLGLLPGTTYHYRVAAWNSLGNSAFAGPANASTKAMTWVRTTDGPIRSEHSAIYDSLGRRMIVFGGFDGTIFDFTNDLWSLNLNPLTPAMASPANFWTPLGVLANAPTERLGHSAVYDTLRNRMIVFGGLDLNNVYQNDVYILTLGATPTWSAAAVTGTLPAGRMGHTAIYDPVNQQMVVFGGNDPSGEMSDAHTLSLPAAPPFAWSPVPPVGGPLRRTEPSAIYDGVRQQMLVFGGIDNLTLPDGSVLSNATSSLSLGASPTWSALTFTSTPSFRYGHSAVFDATNQRMVVFGGDTTTIPTSNVELWSVRLDVSSSWTFLSPFTGPPPVGGRYGHTAIYDSGNQRMVVFGGNDDSSFPAYGETWLTDF